MVISLEQCKRLEKSPQFKVFIVKYGFKSYYEYLDLCTLEERIIACNDYVIYINNLKNNGN